MTRARSGFTLLEMMIALGVAAVLASISLPLLSNVIASGGPRRAAAELLGDLRQTRAFALSGYRLKTAPGWSPTDRTVNSGLRFSSDTTYEVFVDRNGATDGDELVLRTVKLSMPMTIVSPAVGTELRFHQNGTMSGGSTDIVITNQEIKVSHTVSVTGGGLIWLH